MAFLTLQVCMFPYQRESGCVVIERGRRPAAGAVAGSAIGAELAAVSVPRRVTGITIHRRALVNAVDVAGLTWHGRVFAGQLERRQVMVEGGGRPTAGVVTGPTVRAELAAVSVPRGVTGITIHRCALVNAVDMAGLTCYRCMLAGQLECCQVMVEAGGFPGAGAMTGSATRAELAAVSVLRRMTGIAVLRCALVNAVDMTGLTWDGRMLAGQLERRQVMIERGRLPRIGIMAGSATRAKLAVVSIPGGVTGKTILRRAFVNAVDVAG